MSVLIKGMEMPTTYPLTVTIYPDGQVLSETVGAKDKHGFAVHIPPHGKLKDADAIEKNLLKMQQAQTGPCSHGVRKSRAVLRDAPTIIPAEPLNEEVNE